MLENIVNFIIQKQNDIAILAFIILGLLYISTIVIFKKLPIIETLIILLSVGLAFFTRYLTRELIVTLLGINLIAWAVVELVFACLLIYVIILIRAQNYKNKMRFYELTPSNIESNIYAYFNKKSKLLMFTDQFYDMLPKNYKNKKKWYRLVKSIVCDGETMSYKKFMNHLRDFGEKTFNIEITFNDFASIKEEVAKAMINENGKLRGYLLYNQKLTPAQLYKDSIMKEYASHLFNFFDSLNEPLAYYDSANGNYILTDLMKKALGTSDAVITTDGLLNYIVEEDVANYKRMLTQKEGSNTYYYRLKTINGIEWFEETRTVEGMYIYNIIHWAKFTPRQMKYLPKEALENEIKNNQESNRSFILVFITLKKIASYAEKLGKDVANVLADRYFAQLTSIKMNQSRVYKLSNVDYCLLFTGIADYERIVSEINSNVSELVNTQVVFNGNKYQMNNALGIVKSESVVNPSPERFIVAGYEALSYATNPDYSRPFSIYREKREERPNYQFDKYRVDINNEFLYDKRKI